MTKVKVFNIAPKIPEELRFLEELSFNMWWSWNPAASELFERIDPALWHSISGNTRRFLAMVPQARLEELAQNKSYLQQLKRIKTEYENRITPALNENEKVTAYFSMEYGIHESIRIYSGGLGILSGDHLKAASDLKLPLVAVGLLYQEGYFKQILDYTGRQLEQYPENEIYYMPLVRAVDPNNNEITVKVRLLDKEVIAAVWKLQVGNIRLFLLDTELPENPPEFRKITKRLYDGDRKMRLEQELVLGIGGFKALVEMGIEPAVCHMNEGHAAFLSLARIPHLVNAFHLDLDVALEIVWRTNVFTTHTPVPAGNEAFETKLLKPYLDALQDEIKLKTKRIINWGLEAPEAPAVAGAIEKKMSMTILGLRMSAFSNGVSELHGVVSRKMWQNVWPGRALNEIPITHITNGVHIATWLSTRKRRLYDRFLEIGWSQSLDKERLTTSTEDIPDEELWMAHESCRHTLIRRCRKNIQAQATGNSAFGKILKDNKVLDPNVLTIGFSRRFATYKRGTLLLKNPERLERLINNPERPVQFVFAGKAHPADKDGKNLIQELIQFSQKPNIRGKMVFLENYDISLARDLVQGADIWLNTPRRPMEASGTSGMKAAANGVLNCSILDGWWAEAYTPERGWAVPSNDDYEDAEDCDAFESNALFNLFENEIVPLFYERSEGIFPLRWIKMMKASIAMALGTFSSTRMVNEYNTKFYLPAAQEYDRLFENDAASAKELREQKARLIASFDKLKIEEPHVEGDLNTAHVGDVFPVSVKAFLSELSPDDIDVELYSGQVNNHNQIFEGNPLVMELAEELGNGYFLFTYNIKCEYSGRFGLTARITPHGDNWKNSKPGFICWPE